jgi:hypothetical protein
MRFHTFRNMRAQKARNHTILKHMGVEERSLYFARLSMPSQDAAAITEISSKLACFAAALMLNGLIAAGMNYLFNGQIRHDTAERGLVPAVKLQITPGITVVAAERSPDRKLR